MYVRPIYEGLPTTVIEAAKKTDYIKKILKVAQMKF